MIPRSCGCALKHLQSLVLPLLMGIYSQGQCYASLSVLLQIKPVVEGMEPKTLKRSIAGPPIQLPQMGFYCEDAPQHVLVISKC